MKKILLMLGLALCAALFIGCASVHQKIDSTSTDPKTGVVYHHQIDSSIRTSGNAVQAVEALKASAGKNSASIGVTGSSQESDLATVIKEAGVAAVQVMDAIYKSGVAAGKESVLAGKAPIK